MLGKFLHACLVAQDTAFGAFRRGVDGQYSQTPSLLAQDVDAEFVDAG